LSLVATGGAAAFIAAPLNLVRLHAVPARRSRVCCICGCMLCLHEEVESFPMVPNMFNHFGSSCICACRCSCHRVAHRSQPPATAGKWVMPSRTLRHRARVLLWLRPRLHNSAICDGARSVVFVCIDVIFPGARASALVLADVRGCHRLLCN